MSKEIDHSYTEEIVCPYCGYEHENSWEWEGSGGREECAECGKEFKWESETVVTYCTEKLKK